MTGLAGSVMDSQIQNNEIGSSGSGIYADITRALFFKFDAVMIVSCEHQTPYPHQDFF